jgi:N-acetylglucosamine kinase-like BadF-type ATPase
MSDLVFLGLDGGGTKTQATLIDADAREIARATSGPSNYHSVGQETAQASLQAAMQQLLDQAVVTWDDVGAIGLGMAGVARPRDYQVVRALLAEVAPTTCLALTHDAEAALVGGAGRRYGVALIAGTGAIAYGVNARGQTRRADGWGYLLGDEGSGYWIGREALRATARACDGRDPPTRLQSAILAELGLNACGELVHWAYETGLDVPQIAALVPPVLAAAQQDDAVALGILQQAGALLGSTLCAVILGLEMATETFQVVLLGGVLSASALVRETVAAAVKTCAPHAALIQPKNDAAFGAALLARDLWTNQGRKHR